MPPRGGAGHQWPMAHAALDLSELLGLVAAPAAEANAAGDAAEVAVEAKAEAEDAGEVAAEAEAEAGDAGEVTPEPEAAELLAIVSAAPEVEVVAPQNLDDLLAMVEAPGDAAPPGGAAPPARAAVRPQLSRWGRRAMANAMRGQKRMAQAMGCVADAAGRLVAHCNSKRLRLGEAVAMPKRRPGEKAVLECPAGRRRCHKHPQSWTTLGTLRHAFGALRSSQSHNKRGTSRRLDAASAVTHAHLDWQHGCLKELWLHIGTRATKVEWMWKAVAWDETPTTLRFGMLTSMLRPIAQYWYRDIIDPQSGGAGRREWKRLTFDEYLRRGGGKAASPAKGVLEVLAQDIDLFWCEREGEKGDISVKHQPLFYPCTFMSTSATNTIAEAIEGAQPDLRVAELLALLERGVPLVILSLARDLGAANVRFTHWVGEQVENANEMALQDPTKQRGFAVLVDCSCFSHILNTLGTRAFGRKRLVPSLHAVAVTCNNVKRLSILEKARSSSAVVRRRERER